MVPKSEVRRMQREVRDVLMNVWDPIGVKDEPACADEYDSYVGAVLGLLIRRESDEKIAQHLAEIEAVRMGLSTKAANMGPTVQALRRIELWNGSE